MLINPIFIESEEYTKKKNCRKKGIFLDGFFCVTRFGTKTLAPLYLRAIPFGILWGGGGMENFAEPPLTYF